MSHSLAWVTPFGPASDIGAFSHNLLREFHRAAETLDATITVFVNAHGQTYWTPLPTVALTGAGTDIEMLLGFDFVVFNIGNNTAHHGHINRLALQVPGVVIVHDLVMHGALAAMLRFGAGKAEARPDIYTLLVGDRYGAHGLDAVAQSRLCMAAASALYAPWDSPAVAEMPLIEPFVESCAALVVHSAHAEAMLSPPVETKVLRLALPWDQKPSLSDAEWDEWSRRTTEARSCVIVCIGHIGRTKCLDQVVLAFAGSEHLRGSATLLIAGHPDDGEYLAQLRRMVARFDLAACVGFELSASVDRLREIKLAADIFVNLRHPNTESASGSLTEQLNAGKPVVTYPTGAYGDIDPDAVVRVDHRAGVSALAAALETLVDDPPSRVRIGAAGRAHVRRIGRAEYVAQLWAFLCANRRQLRARKACAAFRRAVPDLAPGEVGTTWLAGLNRARRPFVALAGSRLSLDILPFQNWEDDALAMHVAVGVFGREAGSPLELALRARLPGADRVDWYEAVSQAHLIWRMAEDASPAGALHALDHPVLLPRAWQLLAALGRWNLVRCCYVGLLGRHATPAEIAGHVTAATTGTTQELIARFLHSDEFLSRSASPDAVRALHDAAAAMDLPNGHGALLLLDDAISFTSVNPHGMDYLTPGWYPAESDGTWSPTRDAILLFRSNTSARQLTLTVIGRIIGKAGSERTVHVHVDGRHALSQSGPAMEWLTLVLPVEQPSGEPGAHDIRFDCEHTLRPCDIGLGEDARQLGFGLRSVLLAAAGPRDDRVMIGSRRASVSPDIQRDLAAAALDLFDQHVAALARAFAGGDFDAGYYTTHRARFEKTLGLIPPGEATSRALEVGATAFMQVALKSVFGYGEVIGTESSTLIEHKMYHKPIEVAGIHVRNVTVSIDIESDIFPFADASFDFVACCEVIEHLDIDPMFMLAEINRICRLDGVLLLTTPNCCSARNLWKIAHGWRPHFFTQYTRDRSPYRHNFEYDIHALLLLLNAAGFTIEHLATHDVFEPTLPEAADFIARNQLPAECRGDDIFVLARRSGTVSDRWPEGMYV
jgi:SAM-dependent methyltransferase